MEFLLVGVGGALGAILRYLLGLLPYQGSFPFKTWAINLAGSFLIGWLSARLGRQAWFPGDQLLLITGLCGGFTTFSTFSLAICSSNSRRQATIPKPCSTWLAA